VSDRIAVAGHSFGGYTTLAVGGGQWDIDLLLAFCASGTLPAGGCNALTTYESIYREGFLDPRVDALLPMTPGAVILFGAEGLTDIAPPTLLLTGALDQTTPNATDGDPAWLGLATSTDHLRVDFATAGHFTFSDACTLNLGVAITDGCGPGFLPSERAHRAINAYALAFLDLHLRDDRRGAALLSGELTIEPDVTLSFGR
jgi:predicted dienelactone hydrolase